MKEQVEMAASGLKRVATRGFYNRVMGRRRNVVSYSCPTDYLPKQEISTVEQFIKKQQQKAVKK